MHISVINQSRRIAPVDLAAMIAAVEQQLRLHWAPAWEHEIPTIAAYDTPPEGSCPIYLFETIGDARLLGYHTKDLQGGYYGAVAVSNILDNGGAVLKHSKGFTVSAALSHEAIELPTDANVSIWVDGPARPEGSQWALETCDPVQADFYLINDVCVSDFVLPSWFEERNTRGPWNYLRTLTGPFTLRHGGYALIRPPGGNEAVAAPRIVDSGLSAELRERKLSFVGGRTARRLYV